MMNRLTTLLGRYSFAAALLYFGLIVVFVVVAIQNMFDLMDRRNAVEAAAGTLQQFEARRAAAPGRRAPADASAAVGSPFLEGATVSVAGAALLQRVTAATVRFGGDILSSQVDLDSARAKGGVAVTTSFEINPSFLQDFLYDLEAGMPFIFVDQLVVQAPTAASGTERGRLRVLMSVSAQWEGK